MRERVKQYLLNIREGMKAEAKAAQRAYIALGITVFLGTLITGSLELSRATNASMWQSAIEENGTEEQKAAAGNHVYDTHPLTQCSKWYDEKLAKQWQADLAEICD